MRFLRRILRYLLNIALSRTRLIIVDRREANQNKAVRQILERLLVDDRLSLRPPVQRGTAPAGIVFSKDRPLQLHALLASYFEQVTHPAPLHILYRVSDMHFEAGYRELAGLFTQHPVTFIREESFCSDLRGLVGKTSAPMLFFLVDDIIVVEPFDMQEFAGVDTDRFVPSLRLGKQLTYCYTMRQQQPLPPFMPGIVDDPDRLVWRWSDGAYDWGYPLSLDGHFFSTHEMQAIIETMPFSSPNSLESHLQRLNGIFLPRLGICYSTSRIVNVPLNKVQSEERNRSRDVDAAFLLEQWKKGMQLDHRALYGCRNISAHQDLPCSFVVRNSPLAQPASER